MRRPGSMNGKIFRSAAETEERNDVIKFKHPQATSHALNCVKPERPQNEYIKPFQFKSREQNGGQIDPRTKLAGRPRLFTGSQEAQRRHRTGV
jgi:hypothetical protein